MRILFPDNIHFHERNFKSLFECIRIYNYETVFNEERTDWMTLFGDYQRKKNELHEEVRWLTTLSAEEIAKLEYKGVPVFQVAKAETLCSLVSKPAWDEIDIPGDDDRKLLDVLYKNAHGTLILNCAATVNWLDFWVTKLKSLPHCSHCCIFSGSLIYARSLAYLLKVRDTKVFILESFFTGNEYYFEERHEPIANNTKLGIKSYYENIPVNFSSDNTLDRERIQAYNKYLNRHNKNVKQPHPPYDPISFNNENGIVLIIGQVANDFSILETSLHDLNIVNVYWKLIRQILEKTDYNIVFKGHPWEINKVSCYQELTISRLKRRTQKELNNDEKSRILYVQDYNLESLFSESEYAIALCSQSLIEAACHGLKPIQFGKAFFGGKGFTFDATNCDEVVEILNRPDSSGTLSIEEYNQLELFLIRALCKHLVTNDGGADRIKELLTYPSAPRLSYRRTREQALSIENVPTKPRSPLQRKWRKFKRNPYKFFKDVNLKPLRLLRFFFLPYMFLK